MFIIESFGEEVNSNSRKNQSPKKILIELWYTEFIKKLEEHYKDGKCNWKDHINFKPRPFLLIDKSEFRRQKEKSPTLKTLLYLDGVLEKIELQLNTTTLIKENKNIVSKYVIVNDC
jgi:hypothetical protein